MAEEIKIEFDLTMTGDDVLLNGMQRASERIKTPFGRGVLTKVHREVLADAGDAFKTEGKSTGQGWKPLSPTYAARKAVTHPGRPILVRDAKMRDEVTKKAGSKAWTPSKLKAQVLFRNKILSYHQRGGGKLPSRPVVVATRDLAHRIAGHIRDGITGVNTQGVKPLFHE